MRAFSTIGWFMCQAIGTMQLDRDASPLGLVARAWAADVEHAGRRAGISDGPHPSLRRIYERPDPNNIKAILRHVKAVIDRGNIPDRVHELSTQVKPLMRLATDQSKATCEPREEGISYVRV